MTKKKMSKTTQNNDFELMQVRNTILHQKKIDFFNKTLFFTLIALIIVSTTIFGIVINNHKDRFYILNGKQYTRIYDSMKLSEQVAINQAYNLLEFNYTNASQSSTRFAKMTVYGSQARDYILKLVNDKYVENTIKFKINHIFKFEDVESKKNPIGYTHIIKGKQYDINNVGTTEKNIVIIFKMIFSEISDSNPTGYYINEINAKFFENDN